MQRLFNSLNVKKNVFVEKWNTHSVDARQLKGTEGSEDGEELPAERSALK